VITSDFTNQFCYHQNAGQLPIGGENEVRLCARRDWIWGNGGI